MTTSLKQLAVLFGLCAGLSTIFIPHAAKAFPVIMFGPISFFTGEAVLDINMDVWISGLVAILVWWRLISWSMKGFRAYLLLSVWPLGGFCGLLSLLVNSFVT